MLLLAALMLGQAWAKDARMPISIGALLPLGETGDTTSMGDLRKSAREFRDALKVAVETVNTSDDFEVTISYDGNLLDSGLDDGFPDIGAGDSVEGATVDARNSAYASANSGSTLCNNAQALCNNADVVAALGAWRSTRSIGAARCCMTKDKLPQISYGSTSNYLANQNEFPFFFRTVPNDDNQSQGLVALLTEYGYDTVSMVYTTDAYAGGMAQKFKQLWLAAGNNFSPAVANANDVSNDISFEMGKGAEKAEEIVAKLAAESQTGVTVIFAIMSDSDEIMKQLEKMNMIGDGFTYFGADGSVSTSLSGTNAHLENAFQGFVGTNIKLGATNTVAYTDMVSKWTEMSNSKSYDMEPELPWANKEFAVANPFAAQMYDAVMVVAKAADRWYKTQTCDYDADGAACVITREQLRTELLRSDLEVIGIGNTESCTSDSGKQCFKFTSREGPASYDIVNAEGDQWIDIGDYSPDGLDIRHHPRWPSGSTDVPSQDRKKIDYVIKAPNGDELARVKAGTNKNLRLPIKLGGLFPLGIVEGAAGKAGLGSLADQGIEWRDAFRVAAALVNADDSGFDVFIEYDDDPVTGTLMDTGLDADFAGDDNTMGVAEGDNEAKLGSTPSERNAKFAADLANSQLCKGAKQLCDDTDVLAVIGACRSSRSIGAARCCLSETGVPQISYASTSSYLTNPTEFPYFFRALPNDDYQSEALVAILSQYPIDKVSMLYTPDAYAGGMARTFQRLWMEAGNSLSPPAPSATDESNNFIVDMHDVKGEKGRELIDRLKSQGDSSVTLIFAISGDSDALMKHLQDAGMTGRGWYYFGGDGSTSTDLGRTQGGVYQDAYQGFVGTNAKLGETTTNEYIKMANVWDQMYDDNKLTMKPWLGKDHIQTAAMTPQAHDAVMIAATAANNWYKARECSYNPTNPTACKMTRDDMYQELQKPDFVVRNALGNTVPCPIGGGQSEKCFRFDGRDGPVSYEIVNAYSDMWNDVGDYLPGNLQIHHDIEFPGGTREAPKNTVRPQPAAATTTDDDDDGLPSWVPIIIVALILAVCLIALGMCWLVKKEKEGKAVFDATAGGDAM